MSLLECHRGARSGRWNSENAAYARLPKDRPDQEIKVSVGLVEQYVNQFTNLQGAALDLNAKIDWQPEERQNELATLGENYKNNTFRDALQYGVMLVSHVALQSHSHERESKSGDHLANDLR